MALGMQLALNVALALVAALFAIWLAGRPGIRLRYDMTEKGTNTLSTATIGVLGRLEVPLVIDVFWRGEDAPLDVVAPAAMDRVWRLLQLLLVEAGGRIEIRSHTEDARETIETRMRELKLYGYENCLVVSNGDRREVVPFRGGLVDFDPGNPNRNAFQPAAIRSFPAEEALVKAILSVTRGEQQKVYFTTGQGERELEDDSPRGLSILQHALGEEAIECVAWDWHRTSEVPGDCAAIAILAPETAFPPGQREAILGWYDRGGRLVIAAHEDPELLERSDVTELLQAAGMDVGPGVVMNEGIDSLGNRSLEPEYVVLLVVGPRGMAKHPITDPLRQAGRSIVVSRAHPVLVRRQPESPRVGASVPLLQTEAPAWLDLPPFTYFPEQEREETGPFTIGAVSRFLPGSEEAGAKPLDERKEARLAAFGSVGVFENDRADHDADFARNVFRWITARDWRVSVSTRDPDERRLPVHQPGVMAKVSRFALVWVPLFCLALGVLTAYLRSRSGPARART